MTPSAMHAPVAAAESASGTHPRGLYILFLTETWAHFSYFGMQAMLVFYMMKHLAFSQPTASAIYGAYTAAAYFTPFFGGLIADRFLGLRTTVFIGGFLMAAGHFMMVFESLFFPALVLIALGNGAFIPPLTAQVGRLYQYDDPRRDRAYSLYYVGINIGAFLAPLVCGTLGESLGWHWGFAAAGVGMVLGLVIYWTGRRTLPPERPRLAKGSIARAPLMSGDWSAIRSLIAVACMVVMFRIAYEQSGNTIALWVDQYTDRLISIGSWSFLVPATWFQSINPLLIVSLTPVVIALWVRQSSRGTEPQELTKMAIGCALTAIAYLVMVGAALVWSAKGGLVSWGWVTTYFVVLTLGELFVIPVGLALFSRLAPIQTASMMIGMWFLAKFAGSLLAGYFGTFWSRMTPPAFFCIGAAAAGVACVALLMYSRAMRSS